VPPEIFEAAESALIGFEMRFSRCLSIPEVSPYLNSGRVQRTWIVASACFSSDG
jgi:hypothetical protein